MVNDNNDKVQDDNAAHLENRFLAALAVTEHSAAHSDDRGVGDLQEDEIDLGAQSTACRTWYACATWVSACDTVRAMTPMLQRQEKKERTDRGT